MSEMQKSWIRYYGEIQGVIEALHLAGDMPYIELRCKATKKRIACYYAWDRHEEVVAALKRRKGGVVVEGYLTRDARSGAIEKVEATHFHALGVFDPNLFWNFRDTPEGVAGGTQ